jgi:hypothetical protein
MAMGDGAQGWCDGAYKVVVVVGWCVHKTQDAELVGQKKLKRARFRVAVGLQEVEGVAVGLQSPSHAKLREGMGGEVV